MRIWNRYHDGRKLYYVHPGDSGGYICILMAASPQNRCSEINCAMVGGVNDGGAFGVHWWDRRAGGDRMYS